MYIFGDSILHTILINGGLVDDNDLQELIAVYMPEILVEYECCKKVVKNLKNKIRD